AIISQYFTRWIVPFCSPHSNDKVIYTGAMTQATFTIAAIAFLSSAAAATSPPVTFESPCECRDNHGEHRWAVKNDPSTPPVDASTTEPALFRIRQTDASSCYHERA